MAKTKLVTIVIFCKQSKTQNLVKNAWNTHFHESFGTFKYNLGKKFVYNALANLYVNYFFASNEVGRWRVKNFVISDLSGEHRDLGKKTRQNTRS